MAAAEAAASAEPLDGSIGTCAILRITGPGVAR
jgi:hypothetical protein